MNIAVLTTVHPGHDARILYKECASLARAGHAVTLFARETPNAIDEARALGVTYVPLRRTERRADRHKMWSQLYRLLKAQANAFDVWHFHDPELLPLTQLWRFLINPKIKLIYDSHENVPKNLRSRQWLPKPLRGPFSHLFALIERWAMRRCDLVVAATEGIAEHVQRGARHCVVVRNYPLPRKDRPARMREPGDARVRCVYSGGLMPTRGIRELLQVMRKLDSSRYELLLLGPFYSDAFEAEIKASLPPNVTLLPEVPFPQVAAHLATCDIGMMTLLPTENHLDSLPIKLFEYMQVGLPVIGSNFPLWKRLIADAGCGVTLDPTDIDAICSAIVRIGSDRALRERMAASGVEAAATLFSWLSQESVLLAGYESLMPAAAQPRRDASSMSTAGTNS
jgi:glycosyltransferase involved in cell wall biosynthesis